MSGIILFVLWSLVFVGVAHITFRIVLPILAEHGKLFAAPKLGRIIPIQRGRNVVAYLANTKSLGRKVNEETGEVFLGEPGNLGLFWSLYGVRWIGLNTIYHYKLKLWVAGPGGALIETTEDAGSIYLFGTYDVPIPDKNSKEGVTIGCTERVNTETVHAGISIGSPNWFAKTMAAVVSSTRDFIGVSSAEHFYSIQIEGGGTQAISDLVERMKKLNDDTHGNPGLPKTTGQKIVSVNLTAIKLDEIVRKALEAKVVAKKNGQGAIETAKNAAEAVRKTADGKLYSDQQLAKGNEAIGDANNRVTKGQVEALGGPANATAILQAREMAKLTGTYVSGVGVVPQLPINNTGTKTP